MATFAFDLGNKEKARLGARRSSEQSTTYRIVRTGVSHSRTDYAILAGQHEQLAYDCCSGSRKTEKYSAMEIHDLRLFDQTKVKI